MEAYLVRLNGEQRNPHDIVGIYFARSVENLFWLVDDCTTPQDCEYTELGVGGIYWPSPTKTKVPYPPEFDLERVPDSWSPLPRRMSLTEEWLETFVPGDADEVDWLPLAWSDAFGEHVLDEFEEADDDLPTVSGLVRKRRVRPWRRWRRFKIFR